MGIVWHNRYMDETATHQAHIIDDLCKANARLKQDSQIIRDLLTDALHALRNGSPHVTDEFIDRSIAILARQRSTN